MTKLLNSLFKQYKFMPSWVGGLIVVHLEILGIIGLLTFAGVMNTFWINHPHWHHFFFDNFLIFMLCFIPPMEMAALLYYKFVVHARQKYSQYQAFQEERNPITLKLNKIMKHLGIEEN